MADFLSGTVLAKYLQGQVIDTKDELFTNIVAPSGIISLIIAGVAGYLAWTNASARGASNLTKVVVTILAAMFGTLYLIYYAINKMFFEETYERVTGGLFGGARSKRKKKTTRRGKKGRKTKRGKKRGRKKKGRRRTM